MAIFGSIRDVIMFKGIATEFVHDVVSQQIGYYKVMLSDTQPNVYGESLAKSFIGPILIPCLIQRGDFSMVSDDFGPDSRREAAYRFLKEDLVLANVVPEVGDVIMYNELYYEVDNVNENQYILGKNPDYSYSEGLENFGASFSIITECHLSTPERLGIDKQRL